MSIQTINRPPQPNEFSEPTGNFRAGNGMTPPDTLTDRTETFHVDSEGRLIRAIGTALPIDIDYRVPDAPRNALEDPTVPVDELPDTGHPEILLTPDELHPRGSAAGERSRITYFHDPEQIRRAQGLRGVLRHTAEHLPIVQPRPHRHARPEDLFEQTPLPPTAVGNTPPTYHGKHHRS